MAGIFDDLPGARTEAVPGPDGFSGCGLEKKEQAKSKLEPLPLKEDGTIDWQAVQDKCYEILAAELDKPYEGKDYKRPRLRVQMLLNNTQCIQIHSSLPLTDDDKLALAQRVKDRVGQ